VYTATHSTVRPETTAHFNNEGNNSKEARAVLYSMDVTVDHSDFVLDSKSRGHGDRHSQLNDQDCACGRIRRQHSDTRLTRSRGSRHCRTPIKLMALTRWQARLTRRGSQCLWMSDNKVKKVFWGVAARVDIVPGVMVDVRQGSQ